MATGTILLLAGAAAAGAAAGGMFSGGGDSSIPKVEAQTPKKTAERVDQGSEAARKNRLKRAASRTTDMEIPKLSQPGLLGVPGLRQ